MVLIPTLQLTSPYQPAGNVVEPSQSARIRRILQGTDHVARRASVHWLVTARTATTTLLVLGSFSY